MATEAVQEQRVSSRKQAPGRTRDRMVDSAAVLLRERGMAGVTVDAVLAHSGAPRGSVYHHFPGGRDELVVEALQESGSYVSQMLDRATTDGDSHQAVDRFVRFWKRALQDSEFRAGCPVVAAALDQRRPIPEVADLVRRILQRWHEGLAGVLVADGFAPARADRLATLVVAAIEGAIILARASGDAAPLDDVAAELDLLLKHTRRSPA